VPSSWVLLPGLLNVERPSVWRAFLEDNCRGVRCALLCRDNPRHGSRSLAVACDRRRRCQGIWSSAMWGFASALVKCVRPPLLGALRLVSSRGVRCALLCRDNPRHGSRSLAVACDRRRRCQGIWPSAMSGFASGCVVCAAVIRRDVDGTGFVAP